jgi:hypothetical protein
MKNKKMNGYLASGLFLYILVFGVGRYFNIPEFFRGLGAGLCIVLELYGVYLLRNDSNKIKEFKKKLFHKIIRKAN